MEFPPAKRRKTSPSTSIPVSNQNPQLRPDPQNGQPTPSTRASFMSPTRASLARFNPGLLPPIKSTLPRRRGSSGSQHVYSHDLNANGVNNGHTVRRAKSTEPRTVATGMTPTLGSKAIGQEPSVTPRRKSRTSAQGTTPSKRGKLSVVGDFRASPPEEAREEDNVVQYTQNMAHGDLRLHGVNTRLHEIDIADAMPIIDQPQIPSTPSRSGLQGPSLGMRQQEDGEPSLPSTPIQLGLEKPPEPPKGLLFSSPSRRPKRRGIAPAKSSPLKPQPGDPLQPCSRPDSSHSSLGSRVYIANTPKPLPTAQEARLSSMRGKLGELEKQLQEKEDGLIRQLLVPGWEDDDSKGTKEISKQEKELLASSTRVIHLREELRQLELANAAASDPTGGERQNQEAVDRLRDGPAATDHFAAPPKVDPLSQRLAQFLPFSSRPPPSTPKPPSTENQALSQILNLEPSGDSIVPFTVTISDSILLPSTPENALHQSQIIVLSSPSQALLLRLQITVDVTSQTITQMHVMELSDWAEGELGGWLRASSEERSIAAVGTAFRRYWMVCLQRLKCWGEAARDYGDMIADNGAFGKISSQPAIADLAYVIPYLCWQNLPMARGNISLTIQWHISISNDGNIHSDVSALAKFPDTWRRTEDGAELDKVGEAFEMLVNDRGAAQAICVVAGLLFPR